MASILRFRKLCYVEPVSKPSLGFESSNKTTCLREDKGSSVVVVDNDPSCVDVVSLTKEIQTDKKRRRRKEAREWRCVDSCCWMIGCLCTTWWLLLVLYHSMPINMTLPGYQFVESPGTKLKKEGLTAFHPVVLIPGIVTGGLELWEGRPCAEGLFRKRLWGGSFSELFKRPLCWLEHMSLDNKTGLDPLDIRVRAVPGLVAADYFAPGYFVWAVIIENLARIGYEEKNMHMAAYDWRLSFQNTEVRDQSLSRLKSKIELMFVNNGYKKVVVVPHSMGVTYFLHFMKWVEAPPPMGGGGGLGWCAKHIKSIMNIGPTFLGVPKVATSLLSAESKDIALARAMAPGIFDSDILGLQTLEHMIRVARTWDSMVSLLPKGGETIWGNLDWSPEEGFICDQAKKNYFQSSTHNVSQRTNSSDGKLGFRIEEPVHYGRMISFGKETSQLPSSVLQPFNSKGHEHVNHKSSCGEVWTEYDEMSRESLRAIADKKAYTAKSVIDLIRYVAPKMMHRAEGHFSYGIADNVDDPKYSHYKYWSNPLETKLPDAPDLEIYCLYGVGIPTERSYVYKMSTFDKCKSIPFRIDSSADGSDNGCLKGGVYFVDGDESVPVVSAGFMCAKGWRGKNRFNPSGSTTYVREYQHKPPANFFEGRGVQSGAHVDIMGNVALIEDVMRVAAGATGVELGGDKIHSDILSMAERINLPL
ncbi:hypothetical protein AQUCO_01900083v1 [Aquilegia coerulea]|uniref:phospholipid:diacylglycerol acyltransferase n=1 Tax=Aquilegia coerulea TaxID=218851 RepID=A0A2G5DIZ8_AQUCA|nr:hypothetical protein AQUCO_01900083v1 [Aquilegia coerulea]